MQKYAEIWISFKESTCYIGQLVRRYLPLDTKLICIKQLAIASTAIEYRISILFFNNWTDPKRIGRE